MAVSETKAQVGGVQTLIYHVLSFISSVAVVVVVGYLRFVKLALEEAVPHIISELWSLKSPSQTPDAYHIYIARPAS